MISWMKGVKAGCLATRTRRSSDSVSSQCADKRFCSIDVNTLNTVRRCIEPSNDLVISPWHLLQ